MSEHGSDGEVRHASERHDEGEEVAKPPRVDVERVLPRFDAAVGESVRDLQTLDGPEGERRLEHEDPREERDTTGNGEGENRPALPGEVDGQEIHRHSPREHSLREPSDARGAKLVAEELQDGRAGPDEEAVEVAGLDETFAEDVEAARDGVGDRERHADDAKEERDFPEPPPLDLPEADEQ